MYLGNCNLKWAMQMKLFNWASSMYITTCKPKTNDPKIDLERKFKGG
jgi:hypothetical protein